jgi:hypothetical protein
VYPDALHVNEGASAAELAYAGEVLRQNQVVVYGDFLVLRPAGDRILCEVVDQDPLSHRCAEEFAVMVENARLALADSGLDLAGWLLQWRVIDLRPEGIMEMWRAG